MSKIFDMKQKCHGSLFPFIFSFSVIEQTKKNFEESDPRFPRLALQWFSTVDSFEDL